MIRAKPIRAVCILLLGVVVGAPLARAADPPWLARGRKGMVASDSRHASKAGLEILRAGGNAIDAAVAVSFALAVTRPYSTGLGGGGFLIARFANGCVVVQDFRETAPAAATPDMYRVKQYLSADQPPPSRYGHTAVAVPGLVAGRSQILTRFGTLPLQKVVKRAIDLAQMGFPVDDNYVENARDALGTYEKYPQLSSTGRYVWETHLRSGRPRSSGDLLVQPGLARLLTAIAEGGADVFYKGPVAEAIDREMRLHGGLITKEDLAAYKVRERKAIRSTYRGYEVIGMPAPSSGGTAIGEALNVLDVVRFSALAKRDRGMAAHYQIEALKHAFADRARWMGDSDFVKVPVDVLTSAAYARQLARLIEPDAVRDVDTYGATDWSDLRFDQATEDSGTSHFCVVDRWGNVVSSTETINTEFGSLVAIDEWGLILNNEMDDFAADPGTPNAFGLVQSAQNKIEPGKRPLSCMSPTILVKDGEPFMALGASGGPRIITSVLNVLLGVTDFGATLEQAIQRLRPHHQWRPNKILFDAKPHEGLRQALVGRGHEISERRKTGVVQAILRTKDGWIGASDPRKGGRPAGY